jgi:DNA polymerase III subunit delta'
MNAPHPWLEGAWQMLVSAQASGRLAHAYLLSGARGLGLSDLARTFAERLLCESPQAGGTSCGACRGCRLCASGNHPDLRLVQPEEEGKGLLIDQVRELGDFYTLKSHYGGAKVAVLDPADSLNRAAANALLKLLEEPPAGAHMLLVATRPGLLPATVLSRCQRAHVATPSWSTSRTWLEARLASEAGAPALDRTSLAGAPLDLLADILADRATLLDDLIGELCAGLRRPWDPLAAAQRCAGVEAAVVLETLERGLTGAALAAVGCPSPGLALTPATAASLQQLANTLDLARLLRFLSDIGDARALLQRSSGVRAGEVIENLWLSWAGMAGPGVRRESAR